MCFYNVKSYQYYVYIQQCAAISLKFNLKKYCSNFNYIGRDKKIYKLKIISIYSTYCKK